MVSTVYTTLGCTYNQQQTFELLHNIRKLYAASGDDDDDFLDAVNAILAKLYDGIRVGNWGQLQGRFQQGLWLYVI